MKMLYIFLQSGEGTSGLLSTQSFGFWAIIFLLVALFVFFYIRTNKLAAARKQPIPDEALAQKAVGKHDVEEETAAAIALVIHMYKAELHDQESFRITLKRVSRIYSPWSSKIYTLRQNPR